MNTQECVSTVFVPKVKPQDKEIIEWRQIEF